MSFDGKSIQHNWVKGLNATQGMELYKINTADIGYDAENKIIYVPAFWKNTVVAFQLQQAAVFFNKVDYNS